MSYTGNHLIEWGYKPGPWFAEALKRANLMNDAGHSEAEVHQMVNNMAAQVKPKVKMRSIDDLPAGFTNFLPQPQNEVESENMIEVNRAMVEIMRVPTVVAGAVMPDACPAGTIPVGGVVATRDAIHPGYHSADVCCSMAMTVFKDKHDPKDVLDLLTKITHFGPTRRNDRPVEVPERIITGFEKNPFLVNLENTARTHFTTQGDGNHFYFVGQLESTGELAVVSHHGSRGFGANVYKRGMKYAQRETAKIASGVPKGHAWIDTTTENGQYYIEALNVVREWTKHNHFAIHRLLETMLDAEVVDGFWNPHNFVFQKDDVFYHAKGATPSYAGHSRDDFGRCIIPMNMAEPILITEHTNALSALGFAPHGAGRNMSRTRFLRENDPEPPADIDYRFWCGIPDKSELPQAYKPSRGVIDAIKKHNLANIVDRVLPYGSIMAGDWEQEAPWRKK